MELAQDLAFVELLLWFLLADIPVLVWIFKTASDRQWWWCDGDDNNVGRNSSVGTATCYWLDGPGIESRWGARFSAPVQTGPGAYPAFCTMGTSSFPGVKRPGSGADHPPPSKCRGQERVGLYLYSPSGTSWPVMGAPLPLPLQVNTGMLTQIRQRPLPCISIQITIHWSIYHSAMHDLSYRPRR